LRAFDTLKGSSRLEFHSRSPLRLRAVAETGKSSNCKLYPSSVSGWTCILHLQENCSPAGHYSSKRIMLLA
jgi:hypothetical protein